MRGKAPLAVAFVALFCAMSGGAVAAKLITGKQIKNRSITTVDISKGTLRRLEGLDGIDGLDGRPGPQGPAGPPGPVNVARQARFKASLTVGPGQVSHVTATCPPGMGAVHGDWTIIGGASYPFYEITDDASYSVGVDNFDSSINADAEATVFCVPTGSAVAARSNRGPQSKLRGLDTAQAATHE